MMKILKIENINKSFKELEVLKNLSFTVEEKTIFGFIGKNGAGKTTTMKAVLGLIKVDSGEIYVCDEKVRFGENNTNQYIGYLPDVPEFYNYMNPREYLKLCGEIKGMKPDEIKKKTKELLKLVGLEKVNRKIGGFSRGMKQRLGIAQALITSPKLLICDEPTSALDPIGRNDILDILLKLKEHTTVVFSTHILSDVEKICDRIGVLDNGNIVLEGNLSEIKKHYRSNQIILECSTDNKSLEEINKGINSLPYVTKSELKKNSFIVYLNDAQNDGSILLKDLLKEKIIITRYEVVEPNLENLFMEVIK